MPFYWLTCFGPGLERATDCCHPSCPRANGQCGWCLSGPGSAHRLKRSRAGRTRPFIPSTWHPCRARRMDLCDPTVPSHLLSLYWKTWSLGVRWVGLNPTQRSRRRCNVKLAKAFLKLQSFLLASAHPHGKMGKSDQREVSGCLRVRECATRFLLNHRNQDPGMVPAPGSGPSVPLAGARLPASSAVFLETPGPVSHSKARPPGTLLSHPPGLLCPLKLLPWLFSKVVFVTMSL